VHRVTITHRTIVVYFLLGGIDDRIGEALVNVGGGSVREVRMPNGF
jgi:hypothetical protein